ncbi:hypothetical protein METP2_02581 [Methanosarcinales archaeon]|nr:hypothetical protein METP2_02581 [Methanosarcinales archaeon]
MIAILIKSLASGCGNLRDYRMGIEYTEINPKRRRYFKVDCQRKRNNAFGYAQHKKGRSGFVVQ